MINPELTRRQFLKAAAITAGGSLLYTLPGNRGLIPFMNSDEKEAVKRTILAMGTLVSISIYPDRDANLALVFEKSFAEIQRIEKLMSSHDPESELSKINNAAGIAEVFVNQELFSVIEQSIDMHTVSGGSFDISVLPLIKKLGFRASIQGEISAKDIQNARALVGSESIDLDRAGSTVFLRKPGMGIDLGSIAKGYAVDKAVEVLTANGVENALINAGGDIYALGAPPGKTGWTIGIKHPLQPDKLISKLTVTNKAAATSGNYEQFVSLNGRTIGHILNSGSGDLNETTLSATTIAASAVQADVFSTAIYNMDKNRGINVANEQDAVECLHICENSSIELSKSYGMQSNDLE